MHVEGCFVWVHWRCSLARKAPVDKRSRPPRLVRPCQTDGGLLDVFVRVGALVSAEGDDNADVVQRALRRPRLCYWQMSCRSYE
jgi:hypothetical protein